MHTSAKTDLFRKLVSVACRCCVCVSMSGRKAVIGPENGSPDADIMFVGEAPGRFGADRIRVPFRGDRAGAAFEILLQKSGLKREQAYITNAVLCNPRDSRGRNRHPSISEVRNCAQMLEAQIELVDPRLVVTLGETALSALALIKEHDFELTRDAGRSACWMGRLLVPLYHPSPRARRWRSLRQQVRDFRFVGSLI